MMNLFWFFVRSFLWGVALVFLYMIFIEKKKIDGICLAVFLVVIGVIFAETFQDNISRKGAEDDHAQ